MTELNNNNTEVPKGMENICQQTQTSRRRRLCSVVAPVLKVEYTQEGKRTVVVSDKKHTQNSEVVHPAEDVIKTTMPVRMSANRARSFCANHARVHSGSDSFSMSAGRTLTVPGSLQRHCSLPRRVGLKRLDNRNVRDTFNRAAFHQATNSTEFLSSGFLPATQRRPCDMPANTENCREAVGRPELAINLPAFPKKDSQVVRCASAQRKTQRSMSAHSVALPGPDSSVLRDPVTGKMYKRGKLLGKGGFAKVYEGLELSTNKKYALKIIDKSRLARPPQREKVDAEIELHCAASERLHPNVAGFETSFENARIICLVMELCEKRSLAQHLRRKEFLSEAEVSDITWQIVGGLAHIHGCGLLHRDLKLGNILLADDMTVKIGDFGLATRASWGKRKTICGTPNFIAPEVLQRQGHGPEADIWAVGCILYTLLVGKPPFETASLKDTYKCILKNSYRIPSTVSQEAADLVRWMLRSKPNARPTVYDITKHAFFVKNQTEKRLPSLDDLAKKFPSKEISSERFLPLRRKSVLPRLTVQDQLSSDSASSNQVQIRHNSCPSDPCSAYSGSNNALRNVPTSSAGPKISIINHINQAATENEGTSSSSSNTCVEDETEGKTSATQAKERLDALAKKSPSLDNVCKNNSSPQTSEDEKNSFEPIKNAPACEKKGKNNAKESAEKSKTPARKQNSNGLKIKKSPVKLLASKLQKLKLPSPKNCMKAAAHTIKSKASDCKTANGTPIIPTIVLSAAEPQATWVTKWVDYSNKYGFGYQLADGSICVLFNDGSHIALMADGKTVEYTEPDWESSSTFAFPIESPPNALLRSVKILQHFTLYMDKNLRRGSVAAPRNCNEISEDNKRPSVRMLTWSRTSDHVAMYLNNGTLQVNFCNDHTKINVSNIHRRSAMAVTYVNEDKETTVYSGCDLMSVTDSGLYTRLQKVHKEFHLLLGNDDCISHPFCGLLRDSATASTKPTFERRDAMVAVA